MTVTPDPQLREICRRKLARAARRLHTHAETVVACEATPADAILREARLRNANLVVVGMRRSWVDRLPGASVAAQVVNQAWRSVLVAPLDAATSPLAPQPGRA